MQITDLLVPERVALNVQVADKAMAIHAMVGMLDRTGCLRDAVEYEKNVLEREAQGTTGVGGGEWSFCLNPYCAQNRSR